MEQSRDTGGTHQRRILAGIVPLNRPRSCLTLRRNTWLVLQFFGQFNLNGYERNQAPSLHGYSGLCRISIEYHWHISLPRSVRFAVLRFCCLSVLAEHGHGHGHSHNHLHGPAVENAHVSDAQPVADQDVTGHELKKASVHHHTSPGTPATATSPTQPQSQSNPDLECSSRNPLSRPASLSSSPEEHHMDSIVQTPLAVPAVLTIPPSHDQEPHSISRRASDSLVPPVRPLSFSSMYGYPHATRAMLIQAAHDLASSRSHTPFAEGSLRDIESAGDQILATSEAETHMAASNVTAQTPAVASSKPHGHTHDPRHDHSHGSMNMRGLLLHVFGDALGNLGVVASGLIIWLAKGKFRFYFDPMISLVITAIIFSSALPLGECNRICFPSRQKAADSVMQSEAQHLFSYKASRPQLMWTTSRRRYSLSKESSPFTNYMSGNFRRRNWLHRCTSLRTAHMIS